MNKEEVYELLELISLNYPNQIRDFESMAIAWLQELQQYDKHDVFEKTKELMADVRYQKTLPTLFYIIKDLKAVKEKIDWEKSVYYCDICKKAYNDMEELKIHRERCSSVRYVANQYKKWFNKEVNKKELYEMDQKEFDIRYNKLLEHIMKNTNNFEERQRIQFIFNPPSQEEAKRYLGVGNDK